MTVFKQIARTNKKEIIDEQQDDIEYEMALKGEIKIMLIRLV